MVDSVENDKEIPLSSLTSSTASSTSNSSMFIIRSSMKGASYLMGLQILVRSMTFILNQLLYRNVLPELMGMAQVRMELLASTILFLSREGIRSSLLRWQSMHEKTPSSPSGSSRTSGSSGEGEFRIHRQCMINMAWLVLPLGTTVSYVLYEFYRWMINEKEWEDYRGATFLYCFSALWELAMEPAYIYALNQLKFSIRVINEALAVLVRCFLLYILIVRYDLKLMGFAYAQLGYAMTLFITYYWHYRAELYIFRPRTITALSMYFGYVKQETVTYAITLTKQSVLKHLLSEGDRIVLSVLSSLYDQGMYALVSNYGSLVARFLFQPIEESSRTMFAKLSKEQQRRDDDSIMQIFFVIFKLMTMIGLMFICFGMNYTHMLIHILLGPKWSETDTPSILSVYCIYVFLMGINGITEAFVHAMSDNRQLSRLNRWMIIFTLIYATAAVSLVGIFGTKGIIFANSVNMICRIMYSFNEIGLYMRAYYNLTTADALKASLPHTKTCFVFMFDWIMIVVAFHLQLSMVKYFFLGVGLFIATVFFIYRIEVEFVLHLRQYLQ